MAIDRQLRQSRSAGTRAAAHTGRMQGTAQGKMNEEISRSPRMAAQAKAMPVQREEDDLQMKSAPVQREEDDLQMKTMPVQREEDDLQMKAAPVQREDDDLQMKAVPVQCEEDDLQMKAMPVQREEDDLQMKAAPVQREDDDLQMKAMPAQREEDDLQMKAAPAQRKEAEASRPNNTGLPDNLKSGIESLSGISMDSVKVHYNSPQPAQLNALAYAQGTDIHVAPGQEQHLPHEAWHVVQQAQGRVQPTMQMKEGVPVNDDRSLENEADAMGAKAQALGVEMAANQGATPAVQGAGLASSRSGEEAAVQMNKETEDYLADAQEQFDDEEGALQDVEDEIWESDETVIDYAETQLSLAGYTGWTGTDSDHGDYCRFIWDFGHGVIVGANVHYTAGGKVAGNWYIKGVAGYAPTFAQVVTNAPLARPATTMPWP